MYAAISYLDERLIFIMSKRIRSTLKQCNNIKNIEMLCNYISSFGAEIETVTNTNIYQCITKGCVKKIYYNGWFWGIKKDSTITFCCNAEVVHKEYFPVGKEESPKNVFKSLLKLIKKFKKSKYNYKCKK